MINNDNLNNLKRSGLRLIGNAVLGFGTLVGAGALLIRQPIGLAAGGVFMLVGFTFIKIGGKRLASRGRNQERRNPRTEFVSDGNVLPYPEDYDYMSQNLERFRKDRDDDDDDDDDEDDDDEDKDEGRRRKRYKKRKRRR